MVGEHDERRQIFVQTAQRIVHPRSHSWKSRLLKSGCLQVGGLTVYSCFSHHVMDEGDVIDTGTQWGNGITKVFSRFAVRSESKG